MAQPDYGLIDNSLAAKNRAIEGFGSVNALMSQVYENQAAQMGLENALIERAAGQAGGGDINKTAQLLAASGRPREGAALSKAAAEIGKLDTEAVNTRLKSAASLSTMANTPGEMAALMRAEFSDPLLGKFYTQMGLTPDKAEAMLTEASKTPEGFRQFKMSRVMGLEKMYDQLNAEQNIKIHQGNLAVSQGNLAVSRERLAQEMAGGQLTPETITMVANMFLKTGVLPALGMGKQAAAARQQILNEATRIGTTGNEGQPAPTTADVAGNIVSAKQDYKSQEKATKDFATGVQGRSVNSFNTAIDHLSTMDKLSDALANGDIKAINTIGNTIARQTGAPAPTSFDAARQIVADEVIKTIVANGGSMKEREKAAEMFSSANSPAQLKGVINTYKDLMGGQLKSLELQYNNTTGRKDFEKKLTPAAKETLSKLRSSETTNIPQGAIDALKSGKGTDEQFDAIFGKGAAAKVKGK